MHRNHTYVHQGGIGSIVIVAMTNIVARRFLPEAPKYEPLAHVFAFGRFTVENHAWVNQTVL